MSKDDEDISVTAKLKLSGFLIDERPVVFIRDDATNQRFLRALDHEYWSYQAQVHAEQLGSDVEVVRQRAATALRVVYGQAVETLFALLGAIAQAPKFPI